MIGFAEDFGESDEASNARRSRAEMFRQSLRPRRLWLPQKALNWVVPLREQSY
jgi:hypothetical protein